MVEASFLIPWLCVLFVFLVFFTLYAHDHAVCVHTALECGIKGTYPDGRTNLQIQADVTEELRQKLSERLLWLQEETVEVRVSTARITVRIFGRGSFLPVPEIEVEKEIIRVWPCETLRRTRWMRKGSESTGPAAVLDGNGG